MMYSLTKMHITPDDYLAKYEEYDDADFSYVKYFIEPYGSHEINEMSDTHYKEGDEVPYHEHERGYAVSYTHLIAQFRPSSKKIVHFSFELFSFLLRK